MKQVIASQSLFIVGESLVREQCTRTVDLKVMLIMRVVKVLSAVVSVYVVWYVKV